ncbi:MAG TPA: hypothetical protein ENI64_13505 [Gammaproteobacteria bacterium]|nr:hypothetical protein [Gammaproteobacteria bacterium]
MTNAINRDKAWQWLLIVTLLCLFTLPAQAAIPDDLDYQGYLTDSGGSPVNSSVSVTFLLYNVGSGGIALWGDTQPVAVNNGLFTVKLGRPGNPFPLGLFDAPLWLGIDVAGDGEMSPRIALSSAAFAHKADDAFTLEGSSASSLDQSAHVTDTGNPHGVTATQVGAIDSASFTLHTGDASAHHSKTTSFTDLIDQAADAQLPAAIARDAEIMPMVLGGDGSGSTLDADFFDGFDSTAFMSSGTDIWVNTTGDTMSGNLNVLANLGVGTTSPGSKFHVYQNSGSAVTGTFETTVAQNWLSFYTGNGYIGYSGVYSGTYDMDFGTGAGNSTGNVNLVTAAIPRLTVKQNGNVGIGTTNPLNVLDVRGGVSGYLGVFSNDNNTSGSTYGVSVSGDARGTGTGNGWGGSFYGFGGNTSGTAYGTRNYANASGSARAYGVYSQANGGTTTGMEYAFFGLGKSYFSDNVGIATQTPATKLHINASTDASFVNGSGVVLIGSESSTNIIMDTNEIIARSNGAPAKLYLNRQGTFVVVPGLEITGGADLAEPFNINDSPLIKPGMVVAIDKNNPGQLRIADSTYDRTVAGIISGANGINAGLTLNQEGSIADGSHPVALTGRVYAWADASGGSIEPGDLLTTSNTPGHLMKVTDYTKAQGAILGKAMTSLAEGKGFILVLVSLQ